MIYRETARMEGGTSRLPKFFKETMLVTLKCRIENEDEIRESLKYFDQKYRVRYINITHDENTQTPEILVEFMPSEIFPSKILAAIFFVLYMLCQIGIAL